MFFFLGGGGGEIGSKFYPSETNKKMHAFYQGLLI